VLSIIGNSNTFRSCHQANARQLVHKTHINLGGSS